MHTSDLFERAIDGDQRALARAATLLERGGDAAEEIRRHLRSLPTDSQIVGMSGPPGAGKSSLLSSVATHLAAQGTSIAILAVDPTSPVSGGAMLGDRIRMTEAALLPGVFVRSIAARTRLDGLSPAVSDLVNLFAASGFQKVFVETVGSGQNQFAIADYVHSLVLVEAPGAGDGVQMLKAGIMELADIYAVTKGDVPGAHLVSRELRAMLALSETTRDWSPPVILTSAETGDGVGKLIEALEEHNVWLKATGTLGLRQERIARSAIKSRIDTRIDDYFRTDLGTGVLERVASGQLDVSRAESLILTRLAESASRD